MKYEITKGSAEDFECQPDAVVAIYCINGSPNYLYSSMPSSEKLHENWLTCNFEVVAERRPITEPVWDGEGLMPSVGMKCLAKQCSQINADELLVVAIQDGAVFGFWTATGAATGLDVNRWIFLPISSPEDVARNEAIEAMRDVGYTLHAAIRFTKEEMSALYEAGYRKMEQK